MENKAVIIYSIGKIIVFLMVLFSIFLFTVKSIKRLSNILFGLFLLITAFDLTGFFLSDTLNNYPNVLIIKAASSLLQMPLFYLYVISVCFSDFTLKVKHIIHAILFFLFLLIFKITSLSNESFTWYEIVSEIQYFTYIIAIFIVLRRYKTIYLENYSNSNYTSYKWLLQITLLFCTAHILVLIRIGLSYVYNVPYLLGNINILISISALFIICWFVLRALYNPQIFTGVKIELEPIDSSIAKHKVTIEPDITTTESIMKLTSFMEVERPFLDCDLTLQRLAAQINLPERDLSMLINHHLGKHFFDFINEYRINEAKSILEDTNKKEVTILEILYQVGFNSKSSFYTAFKKATNKTPTAYRIEAFSKIK